MQPCQNPTAIGARSVSKRVRTALPALRVLGLVLVLGTAGCGGDSSGSDSGTNNQATESTQPTDPSPDTGAGPETSAAGSDPGGITSEDICTAVSLDAVAQATGLNITGTEASESSTPQCAYTYSTGTGPDSNLTVAASRYTDADAQTIEQAFDGAITGNMGMVGSDADKIEVDAGDEAVFVSGSLLSVGVLRTGDTLVSVIVPPGAVSDESFESLMQVAGTAFE
jgi:hypothetical protein